MGGNNRDTTAHVLLHRAAREATAALARICSGPPHYARTWTPHRLPGTGLTAYVQEGTPTAVSPPPAHRAAR
ncbi:hypothetical protein [Streptomyces sp. MK37H]|uniref:hypothetical protein n=1 Tax=Streptomyces sp. MK37H TaxID=2699117 RepID=UPI001B372FD9|nr:hypothetical protein [Streptomyces sp. MK37H]MBP8533928.1 hypothetical protein [Streptomyces sp. MK37H]